MHDPAIPLSLLLTRSIKQSLFWGIQISLTIVLGSAVAYFAGMHMRAELAVVPLILVGLGGPYQACVIRSERWVPYRSKAMTACLLFGSCWAALNGALIVLLTDTIFSSPSSIDLHSTVGGGAIGFGMGFLISILPRDKKRRVIYG